VDFVGDGTKVQVVPEAVDANRAVKRRASTPFALFVGTLEPRKNVPFLVRLWQRHAATLGDLRLVIAGKEGWDREACDLVKAGVSGVDYIGYVPDFELDNLYSRARCLVYPSLYEGFGLPIMEAMGAGCPVITTPCGSLAEVAGEAAITLDPNHENLWVEALCRLSRDENLRASLSESGLKRAAGFTVERHVTGTLRVLHDALALSCV
jgi:glycosyltransferase involved in cell wall biosynthesis